MPTVGTTQGPPPPSDTFIRLLTEARFEDGSPNQKAVDVFLSWFREHADDSWLGGDDGLGQTQTPLLNALEYCPPEEVTLAILSAWPAAAKTKDPYGNTPLYIALTLPFETQTTDAVTLAILAAFPDAVKEKDAIGYIPLHLALQDETQDEPLEAVTLAIIAAWPAAANIKDPHGSTPLHIALGNNAPEAVSLALLSALAAWPEAVKEKDENADTLLHIALQCNAPDAVTLAVLAAWADAVKEPNNNGNIPIHLALHMDCKVSEAVTHAILAAWPNAIKEKNMDGNTPLHLALEYEANTEAVMLAVLAAWPDAANARNADGVSSLDVAFYNLSPEAVMFAALDAGPDTVDITQLILAIECQIPDTVTLAMFALCPDAANERAKNGDMLLHLVLENNSSEALTLAVLQASPEAVKMERSDGDTPIQLALAKNATDGVILALLDAWPGGVKRIDGHGVGTTLLHTALCFEASEIVALAILAEWPNAVHKMDYDHNTPLHIALQHNASEAVAFAIFDMWPDAVKENDKRGNTLLHYAMQFNAPNEVTGAIFDAWPDAVKTKNANGDTPLHYALQFNADTVWTLRIIDAWPAAAAIMREVETKPDGTERGETPLHIALRTNAPKEVALALFVAWPAAAKKKNREGDIPFDNVASPETFVSLFSILKMDQLSGTTSVPFDDAEANQHKEMLFATNHLSGAFAKDGFSLFSCPAASSASATNLRLRSMINAQPADDAPDTQPLHERLSPVKSVLNICLQSELRVAPTGMCTAFDFNPYISVHVDPAIAIIKQELDVLNAQVAADPDKYRQLLHSLTAADHDIYDKCFGKTINSDLGGDEAAYNKMLDTCAELKSGCTMVDVHVQPTTELMPLVLMVRENVPAYKQAITATIPNAIVVPGKDNTNPSTTQPNISFRDETKAPYRVIEKSLTKGPNPEYPDVSKVLDVFGCIIDCSDYVSMAAVVKAFATKHNSGELQLTRVKNRWTDPSGGGWRDLMLNLVINGIVFEVQIVLHSMLVARKSLDAHKAYTQFRSFAEAFNMLKLSIELDGSSHGGDGHASNNMLSNALQVERAARKELQAEVAQLRAELHAAAAENRRLRAEGAGNRRRSTAV